MDIITLIKKNPAFFNRGLVEKAAGLRPGMLSRILSGEKWRHLTPEQEAKAKKYFEKMHDTLSQFIKQ